MTQHPFFGPGIDRNRSGRTIGPGPQPNDDVQPIFVPAPHLRGTGPLSRELIDEEARQQRIQQHAEQVRARIQPKLMNGRQLVQNAARALLREGFSVDQVSAAAVGLLTTLRDPDRPLYYIVHNDILAVQRELDAEDGPQPA